MNAFWAYICAWIATLFLCGVGLLVVHIAMKIIKWLVTVL